MKKMLITGASGFLGRRVAAYFRDEYEIFTPGHGELNITDSENVASAFASFRPDVVIHCAAVSDVGKCEIEQEKSWNINVNGSIHVAQVSKDVSAKCILCSSDQVYIGSAVQYPHVEEEKLVPSNLYGMGKLKAEQECLKVNPDCVLLRLSWMYDRKTLSQTEHGDFMRTLLRQIETPDPLCYPVYDRRGITDVNEVVRNLEKVMQLPGGVYNYGSPNDRDTFQMMKDVFEELGLDGVRFEANEQAFCDQPRNLCMCVDKLNRYGITFLSTEEALIRNLKTALGERRI